jgi:uncharacterized membrane protein
MRRSLWVLLIASLMANAVAVGVWIGRRGFAPPPRPDLVPPAAHEALRSLDRPRRDDLQSALTAARRAAVEEHGGRTDGHRRLIAVLVAEKFDVAAWRQASADLQAARAARGAQLGQAIENLAVKATYEERLALAALLYDRPKRLHHDRHARGGERD